MPAETVNRSGRRTSPARSRAIAATGAARDHYSEDDSVLKTSTDDKFNIRPNPSENLAFRQNPASRPATSRQEKKLTAPLVRYCSATFLLPFDLQGDVDELVLLAADKLALAGPVQQLVGRHTVALRLSDSMFEEA